MRAVARAQASIPVLIILVAILLGGPSVVSRNATYITAIHLYQGIRKPEATARSVSFAAKAACIAHLCHDCCAEPAATTEALLTRLDAEVMRARTPLRWLDANLHLSAADMQLGGLSASSRLERDYAALYGPSYVEARLFLPSDQFVSATVSVEVVHDYPPPVTLLVEVNERPAATLQYERGDGSWGVQTETIVLQPGFARMRVWFVNDYLDAERGLDRNAFVRQIAIIPGAAP